MADAPAPHPAPSGAAQNTARTVTMLALVAALALLPMIAKVGDFGAMTSFMTRIVILAIAASSLNLILGWGGMVSFGHAAWYGVGGYVVGMLYQHATEGEPLWGFIAGTHQLAITLPLAILVSGALALVLGAISLRTSGVQFIMITLAFAQMIYFLFVSLKAYGGDDGLAIRRRNTLFGLDTRDDVVFYYICLVLAVAWFWFMARLSRSRFGQVLQGVRQSERRMAALGVATYRYKLVAFVIAAMGAGMAGALMANYAKFVSPDMLHWIQSGDLMIMVIIGGVGTLLGPAFGALALIGLESVLAAWTENWQIILGPLLVLLVLFWRGGLSGVLSLLAGGRRG